ncbi:MAG TPA: MarR family winged helix-turn-helix transcriptional regulator [Candidatus Saccharimonadales bacterium]|nr:MarR family winged helix-turn-helix transcriptional regulator [Candidatus Saccharimonadales bacterium]
MGPTNNLSYLIQHLAAVMNKQTDQVLQEQLGIGVSQYRILMLLEWNPRVQQQALAEGLGQTEASISRQIKVLQTKRLISVRQDPNNKRRHIAVPTTLGMQVTEAASNILRRNFGPEFGSLGEDQLMQLINSLLRLHNIVCRPGKAGACDHPLGL